MAVYCVNVNADKAIALFKLNTTLHPESGNAYDSLAEGYEASGNRRAAVDAYRRSLAIDANNTHAQERLSRLTH